jgi:phosphoribosylanthranilate isomerase
VLAKVKFCGMTRPQDAALAGEIGANYVGVVFADGPRRVTPARGREILDAAGPRVKRVGVFGTNSPEEIEKASGEARLDIVQLHADPTSADIRAVRRKFNGEVWAAIRISGSHIPPESELLFTTADAVVAVRGSHSPGTSWQWIWRATEGAPQWCSRAD